MRVVGSTAGADLMRTLVSAITCARPNNNISGSLCNATSVSPQAGTGSLLYSRPLQIWRLRHTTAWRRSAETWQPEKIRSHGEGLKPSKATWYQTHRQASDRIHSDQRHGIH